MVNPTLVSSRWQENAVANRWEDLEELFVSCANDDLDDCGEVHPALAAFSGEHLRFIAWLRPFPKGEYHDPLIELLALAGPLDADRLALAIAGRAWSLRDPMPPVTADADLRQRVLIIHLVDGARGRPRAVSLVHPFDLTDGTVSWGQRNRLEGGEGWVFRALEVTVNSRARMRASDDQIVAQAMRVVALGHDLYLRSDLSQRLDADAGAPGGRGSLRRGAGIEARRRAVCSRGSSPTRRGENPAP